MVRDLHAAHFNTLYFQVRPRGDAYYRSAYEPWAEALTGTLGLDPGWDPLQFLLDEARAFGIEVHGWFNVYKVRGPNPVPASSPLHVTRAHPDWTVADEGGELWLDPGNPAARRYLLEVATDLIGKYDLDGISFDFVRYPGRVFPDAESYRRWGSGEERDAWRRGNIDRFISEFAGIARRIRPMLKVGAAPFGVYEDDPESGTSGSPQAVYQDSEKWLRSGDLDYLSPQIYWDFGASRGDPDFGTLVRRWQAGASGRHIYAGIAAYKPEVFRQIPRQIDASRAAGNQGQAYFRFESIRSLDMFGGRYDAPALIPPMSWKDSLPPLPPANLAVAEMSTNVFHLEWTRPRPGADGDTARGYVIYRSSPGPPRTDIPTTIVAILPGSRNYYIDSVTTPAGFTYAYAVTSLDKGMNESAPSTVGTGVIRELLALKGRLSTVMSLSVSLGASGPPLLFAFRIVAPQRVRLEVRASGSDGTERLVASLLDEERTEGMHVVGYAGQALTPGRYIVRLTAGGNRVEQSFRVGR
jgi:uncharacterized lipoprotein YddW (UPF0748 family)